MPESKFSPEKEKSKFARVTGVIKTSEREYVDPKKNMPIMIYIRQPL